MLINVTKSKMNQKAYSILFCALLASTFVHEIRAKAAANPSFAAQIAERASAPVRETCVLECEGTSINVTIGVSIIVNANASLIGFVNGTFCIIIDINAGLIAVCNGISGVLIIINFITGNGLYLSKGGWVEAEDGPFQPYFNKLSTLKSVLNITGGVEFTVSTASTLILGKINEVLSNLISNFRFLVQANIKLGIQTLVTYCTQLRGLLTGTLKGIFALIKTTGELIKINFDLIGVLNILVAISTIIVKIPGGLEALIRAGIVLNLVALFQAESGVHILVIIFLAFGDNAEFLKILESSLNEVESLFKFIAKIGGDSNIGLTGLFKFLASLVGFIKGKVKLEVVILTLLLFCVYNSQESRKELSVRLFNILQIFLDVVVKVGATQIFAGLVITIKALIAKNLTVGGVNISAIITTLLTGICKSGSYLLQTIIAILVQIKVIVALTDSLSLLLRILIICLNSPNGIYILNAIGIVFKINLSVVTGSIIAYLLGSTNLLQLFLFGLRGFLTASGFKEIIAALKLAISAAGAGISLEALFSAHILLFIKGLFKTWRLGINWEVDVSVTGEVESLLNVYNKTTGISCGSP